jgi:hypothetical protein
LGRGGGREEPFETTKNTVDLFYFIPSTNTGREERGYPYRRQGIPVHKTGDTGQKMGNTGTEDGGYRYRRQGIPVQKTGDTGTEDRGYRYRRQRVLVQKAGDTGTEDRGYRYRRQGILVPSNRVTSSSCYNFARALHNF